MEPDSARLWREPIVVLAAALVFALFVIEYPSAPQIRVGTQTDLTSLGDGFYPPEMSGELQFVWTQPHAQITLGTLDRHIDWIMTADVRMWRPPGTPRPHVRIAVDGAPVFDEVVTRHVPLAIPVSRRAGPSGARIAIDTDPPFIPGSDDRRKLGIALAAITIQPTDAAPHIPVTTVFVGALAVMMMGAGLATLKLPRWWLPALALTIACMQAWLTLRGIAAHVGYSVRALVLASSGTAGALLIAAFAKLRTSLSRHARLALALSLAAWYVKLLLLLHPEMVIGDGVFHAHRFEYVLAGRFFFTSLTPDNYAFPYPILLYLVSRPFSVFTADTTDRLALLRLVTTTADMAAGLALYWMVVRASADRLAGVASVIWYHTIPMTAWIMRWGNLTNAFAQTLFVLAVAMVVALPVDAGRRGTVALLAVTASAALLSHPSTCAILILVLGATAVLYRWSGRELRDSSDGVLVAVALGSVFALAVYYAWFVPVYMTEIVRIGAETTSRIAGPPSSIVARLWRNSELAKMYFGGASIVGAAAGTVYLFRVRVDPRLTLLLRGWVGTCVVFLVVGLVTPIDLRYHFALFPAIALAAGFATSWAWRRGFALRLCAVALMATAAWEGAMPWISALH